MDVFSHGLWGAISFGRKNRKNFWSAFLIGIAPDFFSFGFLFIIMLFSPDRGGFRSGPPDPSLIPSFINYLYNITHSLIIFAIVFFLIWIILKKPFLPLLAWGLHIVMDIFTHSFDFFPTPFLWPISDYKLDIISWGAPWIFFPNIAILLALYIWFFKVKHKRKKQ